MIDTVTLACAALGAAHGLSDEQTSHVEARFREVMYVHPPAPAGEVLALLRQFIAEVRPPLVDPPQLIRPETRPPRTEETGWSCGPCGIGDATTEEAMAHSRATKHEMVQIDA